MGNNNSLSCIACNIESIARFSEVFDNTLHTCEKGSNTSAAGGASAYTFDNYQQDTGTTALYPNAGDRDISGVNYTILGLIGEAGEIANKWKKLFRDYPVFVENHDYPSDVRDSIIAELGDVLWYASQLATELGVTLGDVAAQNIRKLKSRADRGTLSGSGDDR